MKNFKIMAFIVFVSFLLISIIYIFLQFLLTVNLFASVDGDFDKIFIDKDSSQCIILQNNDRFIAELYYINEAGAKHTGFYKWKKDTLILISDRISVNIPEEMKINNAQLIKFYFIQTDDGLSFIKCFSLRNGLWLKFDDQYMQISNKDFSISNETNFTNSDIKDVYHYEKLSWMYHYLIMFDDTSLVNRNWINDEYKLGFEVDSFLNVKLYDCRDSSIHFGYIFSTSGNEIYMDSNGQFNLFYIYFDSISYEENSDVRKLNLSII